jgi:hypothetical protein
VRGWSTFIELPELANVLVTETIGSDPFDERTLKIVKNARRRLLAPSARIISSAPSVYGTAEEVLVESLAASFYNVGRVGAARDGFELDRSSSQSGVRRPRSRLSTSRK